jgi:hypothetical protein
MTEDEKRQQKAMLLLEYQEAEINLAYLREKVRRHEEALAVLAKWLSHARVNHANYRTEDLVRDASIRANLETYRNVFNLDAALALVDEVAEAQERLKDLGKRKSDLGLR